MRSAWVALVLLLLYLVLVFISFRVLDLILWCNHGIPSTHIVDPLLLSVRQLKQLLEIRGVSYTGYVEKKELVELVQESANVLQGEIDELSEAISEDKEKLSLTPEASYFSSATHFYEEVEDTKDSVWLVHVVGRDALLDDYTWRVIRKKVAPFAIRTGVFNCNNDPRLCKSKGWKEPLLLLAMPRGSKPKDRVIMRTCKFKRPQAIIEWLSEELAVRVKKIQDYDEIEREWLPTSNANKTNLSPETSLAVKVLLFTHLLHPPLFLAALSIKFTGRITFGIFSVKKDEVQRFGKVPIYLIITPEKTTIYGKRRKEHFNLTSMNAFLRALQPEINDLFLCSLVLVNMFAMLQFLQVYTDSWWRILVASIWTVVMYNLLLFACWLCICGAMRWPFLSSFGKSASACLRWVVLSNVGNLVRSDWIRLLRSYPLLISSLFVFGRFAGRKLPREGDSESWWEMDCLFRPTTAQLSVPHIELEEGLLIERLAVPSFWLTPVSSPDYIKHLQVWTFIKKIKQDSPEAIETLMDSQTDSVVTTLSKGDLPLIIETTECAICLDKYHEGVFICGLPCGHNYHQKCILVWLQRDNHHCPICRWPAYKIKQN